MGQNKTMDTLIKYKKPLLIIAGILVLVEVIWGVYTLTRQPPKNPLSQTPTSSIQPSPSGSLGLVTLQGPTQVKVGEIFKVDMELTTNSPTDGTDLIVKYDPKVLELVLDGTKASTPGKTYQDYPANSVDPNGVITVSGVTLNKGFVGQGLFGSLNFKAKTKGLTKVNLDFTPGSTTDSNITESSSGKDILGKVSNLEVTIN